MHSSFDEGRPGYLRVIDASHKRGHGAEAPATNGWIIQTGNQGAPRDCNNCASPLLCTAYMSATSQYTPIACQFLCGKRTIFVLRWCTRRLGLCAFWGPFHGFSSFPFSSLTLLPAPNAHRWATAAMCLPLLSRLRGGESL